MNFLKNHGLTIGVIAIIVGLLFIVKLQWDNAKEQEAISRQIIEMKVLQDEIVRNQSKYVSKDDLDKFAKDIDLDLSSIKKDLESFDADLKGISYFIASSLGRRGTDIPSTGTKPKPEDPSNPVPTCPDGTTCPDPYGYLTNAQILALTEPFPGNIEVPIGDVTFESWKAKPWTINILPRNYHITTVLGQDEEGRHYVYNQMQIETNGKRHKIPIKQAEFQEVFPESHFNWWNPKLGLTMAAGISFSTAELMEENEGLVNAAALPGIAFSPFSYGQFNKNPAFLFPQVSVNYDVIRKSANFSIAPVMYNLGQHIEFIENTYIGGAVGIDHHKNVSVTGNLSVTF